MNKKTTEQAKGVTLKQLMDSVKRVARKAKTDEKYARIAKTAEEMWIDKHTTYVR